MLSGEDFGYLKDEEQNRLAIIVKKALLLGSVLFSIVCFIYITINAYYFAYNDKDSDVRVIKSPPEPIKIIEEEDKGTAVKDIDKTIYDNIVGNKNLTRENLNNVKIIAQARTPSAEKPATLKANSAEIIVSNSSGPKSDSPKSAGEMMVYNASEAANKVSDASLVAPKKQDNEKQNPENNLESKPISKTTKTQIQARVQIAALTSKSGAVDYWLRLKKNYPNLFSNLNYFISEVNLGRKGNFYRLQIGNFKNQIEAEDFCRKFIFQAGKTRADCIIVE